MTSTPTTIGQPTSATSVSRLVEQRLRSRSWSQSKCCGIGVPFEVTASLIKLPCLAFLMQVDWFTLRCLRETPRSYPTAKIRRAGCCWLVNGGRLRLQMRSQKWFPIGVWAVRDLKKFASFIVILWSDIYIYRYDIVSVSPIYDLWWFSIYSSSVYSYNHHSHQGRV